MVDQREFRRHGVFSDVFNSVLASAVGFLGSVFDEPKMERLGSLSEEQARYFS
jgi:hypothetical protein